MKKKLVTILLAILSAFQISNYEFAVELIDKGDLSFNFTEEELKEIEYLAKTIYGEARGESIEAKYWVAWVIRNRVDARWRGQKTYESVVTDPYQFSCWNENDVNRPKLDNPKGIAWNECWEIAVSVYTAPAFFNPIPRVFHYHDTSISPPSWTEKLMLVTFPEARKFKFWRG